MSYRLRHTGKPRADLNLVKSGISSGRRSKISVDDSISMKHSSDNFLGPPIVIEISRE
jgi:hypothetical protein